MVTFNSIYLLILMGVDDDPCFVSVCPFRVTGYIASFNLSGHIQQCLRVGVSKCVCVWVYVLKRYTHTIFRYKKAYH